MVNLSNALNSLVLCSDPECKNGIIVVHDAYAADPLTGREQPCDSCLGLLSSIDVAIAN